VAGPGLDEQGQETRGQPGPLGAADRGRPCRSHPGDVPLAVEAARTQSPRSGDSPPDALGPPDTPGAGGEVDPLLPAGRLVAVTGHKPPELGGYGANPVSEAVRAKLAEVLAAKREVDRNLVILTGLGLGAEQLAAEAASEAGVPYVAVLPYPDPDSQWPPASRKAFQALLDGAKATVVLQNKAPASKQLAGAALRRRDAWLARHAHEALTVWDGQDPNVGRAVRALQDALGEDDVWIVAP
jgi:hypothetical protein